MRGYSGPFRYLAFNIYNDCHFGKLASSDSYAYFMSRQEPEHNPIDTYYNRAIDLCSKVVIKEPMGSDKYLHDIFGLSFQDVMNMDPMALMHFEEITKKMIENNKKDLKERLKDVPPIVGKENK